MKKMEVHSTTYLLIENNSLENLTQNTNAVFYPLTKSTIIQLFVEALSYHIPYIIKFNSYDTYKKECLE